MRKEIFCADVEVSNGIIQPHHTMSNNIFYVLHVWQTTTTTISVTVCSFYVFSLSLSLPLTLRLLLLSLSRWMLSNDAFRVAPFILICAPGTFAKLANVYITAGYGYRLGMGISTHRSSVDSCPAFDCEPLRYFYQFFLYATKPLKRL